MKSKNVRLTGAQKDHTQVLLLYCSAEIGTIDQRKSLRTPTGLYFLATYLNIHGISAAVDNFSTSSEEERHACLQRYRPSYVGLSMLTLNRFATMQLANWIKTLWPQTKIVLGGPHASSLPAEIMRREPAVDCVVCGEGEKTFLNLIKCWEQKGDLGTVKGIVYRKGNKVIHNAPRPFMKNLSALPHPAKIFPYEKISTSRGCPFKCQFCSSSQFWGRGIRYHSPKWVVDEIEYLYRNHGIREIYFNDDVFTAEHERVKAICKGIIDRGLFIRFNCMSRVNTLCPERLKWLKRAGCFRIDFGVESGSKRLLRAMGKKATSEQAVRAFRMTREAGIETGCFIIIGFPGEADDSIKATKALVRKLRPTFASFSSMAIYPNSPVYLKFLNDKQLNDDIWFKMQEHTLFIIEEGKKQQYLQYLEELRLDYSTRQADYQMTLAERQANLQRYKGLGHTALELALALSRQGDHAVALQTLARAAASEPNNPFLWHHMAELCFNLDEPALGLDTIQKAMAIQPQNYESHRLAARLLAKAGNPELALDEFKAVIATRPEKIEAYIEQGELLQKMHRFSEAARTFAQAVKIDPYWPPLHSAIQQCEQQINA